MVSKHDTTVLSERRKSVVSLLNSRHLITNEIANCFSRNQYFHARGEKCGKMMKKIALLLALLTCVSASDMTMTEELLMAQNELNIAFEFTELYLLNQMTLWIDNMTILTEDFILPGFFDARDEIIDIRDSTTAYIESIEVIFNAFA
jgi:hypothetical protein